MIVSLYKLQTDGLFYFLQAAEVGANKENSGPKELSHLEEIEIEADEDYTNVMDDNM